MKKLFLMLAVVAMVFGAAIDVNAAPKAKKGGKAKTEQVDKKAAEAAEKAKADSIAAAEKLAAEKAEKEIPGETMHQVLMQKFLEGGWGWMLPILIVLVIGLAIAIERILFLAFSTINTKGFAAQVEKALNAGGIEAAKAVCRNKRGPVASIYYQGLCRYHLGIDAVEKAVVSYGSVQTARLESGLGWLSLFISLAPSLGFMGTVVGLVQSFDSIQAAGDISPALVAGGMKVALLTTLLGLIAAIVLQIFYNIVIVMIDSKVTSMEDSSIDLTDMLTAYSKK